MTRKYSKKRQAILEMLQSTNTHPCAEWIYSELKPQYPDLSLGTVYRNLSLFKTEGDAICVAVVNGQERYDANTSRHAHLICSGCGAVIDVENMDNALSDATIPEVESMTGAFINDFKLEFYGLCNNCVLTACN